MSSNREGRYGKLAIATLVTPGGDTVAYRRRRFLPQGASLDTLAEVAVEEGQRLDLMADQIYGDSEQYWRICDANDAMHPDELTDSLGVVLKAPIPPVGG